MTRDHDVLDDARAALQHAVDPARAERVRARVLRDIASPPRARRAVRARRRSAAWLPATGIVTALAAAAFLVVALQPGRSADTRGDRSGRAAGPPALHLVTDAAGGALAGVDLDSASAAEVLRAAGDSVADRTPVNGGAGWTYLRIDETMRNFRTDTGFVPRQDHVTEQWTSPDGERIFSVTRTVPATEVAIHFEEPGRGIMGAVSWDEVDGRLEGRRASWRVLPHEFSSIEVPRVELRRLLRRARDRDDVAAALAAALDHGDVYYRHGMRCSRAHRGQCTSIADIYADGAGAARSRELYGYGVLLGELASTVLPPDATRATYEFLARAPGIDVVPTAAGTGRDVTIRYRRPHADPPIDVTLATLDAATGRIVRWDVDGRGDPVRYSAVGVATGPGVGGVTCTAHPVQCGELRDLARRLDRDRSARFAGVADWGRIMEVCDGEVLPDGTRIAQPRTLEEVARTFEADRRRAKPCMDAARARVEAGKDPFPDERRGVRSTLGSVRR